MQPIEKYLFKIKFIYPWNDIRALKKISQREMYKTKSMDLITTSFSSKLSLYFNGKLYHPSWYNVYYHSIDYSDTVCLWDFFFNLMRGIKQARNGKEQTIWFVDNPIYLKFRKKRKKVKVWIYEGWDKTKPLPKTELLWKDFVKECVRGAEDFVKGFKKANKTVIKTTPIRKLIRQTKIAKQSI